MATEHLATPGNGAAPTRPDSSWARRRTQPVGEAPQRLIYGAGHPTTELDLQRRLEGILGRQAAVAAILDRVPSLDLPDWYLGAGCITQTVWNELHGYELTFGIGDYDLVYFDADDLSKQAEQEIERRVVALVADLGVVVDVTNEARVHTWYERRFGRSIDPYESSAAAIATWPSTASSVGVRREGAGLEVCAPFGLEDMFRMVVRPNKTLVTRDVYELKAMRWRTTWPLLTVIDW